MDDDQRSYFLLITADGESASGARIPASKLIEWRLAQKLWPLYSSTPNRRHVQVGDTVLLYQGGRLRGSQAIIGGAKIAELLNGSVINEIDPHYSLSTPCKTALRLEEIRIFDRPVEIRPLIGSLSFLPKDAKHWGHSVMVGCRRISAADFDRIVAAGRSPTGMPGSGRETVSIGPPNQRT